jgi:hypothetical protein
VPDLYQFHVNLFAHESSSAFAVTWEDAAAMLERLPRIIFEPDGSFVVSGGAGSSRWQVDGHLFDFAGRLHRVEFRGHCPREAFDELLKCVGWPAQPLVFEMVRAGTRVEEQEFRRAAEVEKSGGGDDPAQ